MKKTLAIIALAVGIGGIAQAGGGKHIVAPPVAPPAPCYGPGYEFGIFGAGFLPENSGHYSDELGGGISLGYFFNENFGLDLGAAWYATDSTVHNYTLDAVYRLPFDCVAPYVFGGGGVHTNSSTTNLWRLGGGVDFRMWETTSLFADAAYNWVGDDVPNYTIIRLGLRFAF